MLPKAVWSARRAHKQDRGSFIPTLLHWKPGGRVVQIPPPLFKFEPWFNA